MVSVNINRVTLTFPLYALEHRSLKRRLLSLVTFGMVGSGSKTQRENIALRNITLKIQEGERVGLIGANGAGKSTLLRLIAGIYYPSEGEIKVEGSIGSMLNISLGTDGEATGWDNLYLRSLLFGINRKTIEENLPKLAELTALGHFLNYPMKTYSSGMKMRIAFAASTQSVSNLMLLDEWLSVGDKYFKKKAEERLLMLIKEAKILVIASHSRRLIERLCNRVIVLEAGNIVMDTDVKTGCDYYFGKKEGEK